MYRYVFSVRAEAREQYIIEAESQEQAEEIYRRGGLIPAVSETYDPEIVRIDELTAVKRTNAAASLLAMQTGTFKAGE